MRVLQIVTKPQRRGAEIFASDLSQQFETQGIAVKTIYLYDFKGDNRLRLRGLDVCLGGSEDHFLERFLGFHPLLLRRVAKEIRSFEPDIVQVNGSRTVKYGAAAKQLTRAQRWRLVYRNIGMPSDWHRGEDTILAYRFMIMPKMDGIIGVSKMSLTDARTLYRLEGPFEIIPNGVSPDRLQVSKSRSELRRERAVGPDEPVLLFLGYLEEAKRPDRFIRVLAEVSRSIPSVRGWMVGDGPMFKDLRQMAKDLDIERRTSFFGNQAEVGSFLSAADLLLLTSETEGLPATILEAAYMGLPVVATRVGGVAECIEDDRTGVLVEEGDDDTFARAVVKLLRDNELRRAMSANASAKARREFTIDRVANKYLDFYRKLMNDSEPSSELNRSDDSWRPARST
jgi:glycosyltransferase involved in cell wall biosynthesis